MLCRVSTTWMALAALVMLPELTACKAKVAMVEEAYEDDFERADPGAQWHDTGGSYQVVGGNLNAKGAYNHPLWLQRRLPRDVRISFDAMSKSASGDIKFEIFGDGETFDPDRGGYVASGYVLIFGGWNNTLSALCRHNEHAEGVKAQRAAPAVVPGQNHRMVVTRKGGTIDWQIDGQPFLTWTDPEPLFGTGNQFFAFNNWEADVYFDNLRIEPL